MVPAAAQAQLPTVPAAARDAAMARVEMDFAAELASATDDGEKQAVYRNRFEALIANETLFPNLTAKQIRDAIAQDSSVATGSVSTLVGSCASRPSQHPPTPPCPTLPPRSWWNGAWGPSSLRSPRI
jgi:hypothetical protein